ncbi:MAG: ABC transporter ATP-binding protein [Magnetococcales bacterium]|nr:ABC transporter ATP-binding protein [Magnetococcales bacterium]
METPLSPRPMTWTRRLRHILPHYRRHALGFAAGFGLLTATNLTSAAIPYVMKLGADALVQGGEAWFITRLAILLMALAAINALLRIGSRVQVYRIGREAEYDLRRSFHEKLLTLDAGYFDRQKTGDLVSRGTADITAIRMFIGPGFLQVSNTFMTYAVVLPVMIALDGQLTLLALAPLPLVILATRLLTRRLYRLSRLVADRFGALSGFIQETVSGMAVLRNHAQEANWTRRFDGQAEELFEAHLRHVRLQSLFAPVMTLAGALGGWIVLAHGGADVAAGRITLGDFVAFNSYLMLLIWPTVGFGWILTVMQRGLAALERIGQVLDSESALPAPDALPSGAPTDDSSAPPPAPGQRGRLEVRHLTLTLPGTDKPVLEDLSLDFPPGSFIGIVGRVGSGKSMLLHALARLLPLPPGSIFLDGADLNQLPEAQLRRRIALAPQESFLFSSPLRDNLLYGVPEGDEAQAWRVAELAGLAREIHQFPEKMDSLVGERGITLSGGQRQRAALARALAMEPDVLLLDDVFSSVDARTEERVLQAIRGFAQGRTTVMVCHRLAALHHAEAIYLLEEGRLVARGTHDELLAHSPLYRDLHSRMARAEALEALQ